MAGTGPIEDAITPLLHLFGWSWRHDTTTGRISVTSPDQTTIVDFNPSQRSGRWWTIAHYGEQVWRAAFTRQTPAEAIAAVTQSLPQLLGDHRHITPLDTTRDPFTVAGHSGWQQLADNPAAWASSDSHCTLRHAPDAEASWRIETDVYDGFDTQWNASFSTHIPTALVTRFLTHLLGPEPVQRRFGSIPSLAVPFALITPLAEPMGNAHLAHALAQLGSALRPHQPATAPHRPR